MPLYACKAHRPRNHRGTQHEDTNWPFALVSTPKPLHPTFTSQYLTASRCCLPEQRLPADAPEPSTSRPSKALSRAANNTSGIDSENQAVMRPPSRASDVVLRPVHSILAAIQTAIPMSLQLARRHGSVIGRHRTLAMGMLFSPPSQQFVSSVGSETARAIFRHGMEPPATNGETGFRLK